MFIHFILTSPYTLSSGYPSPGHGVGWVAQSYYQEGCQMDFCSILSSLLDSALRRYVLILRRVSNLQPLEWCRRASAAILEDVGTCRGGGYLDAGVLREYPPERKITVGHDVVVRFGLKVSVQRETTVDTTFEIAWNQ
jgi:hypothetical protein